MVVVSRKEAARPAVADSDTNLLRTRMPVWSTTPSFLRMIEGILPKSKLRSWLRNNQDLAVSPVQVRMHPQAPSRRKI